MKTVRMFLRKNAPTILTCIGGVGIVATSIMSAKATPKALNLLQQAKDEKGDDLTVVEMVKTAGPVYIPTVLTGAATLVCIFGANALNKKQQASLISAYALLDNSYKKHKDKVEELFGEDGATQVIEEIAKDEYEEKDIQLEDDNKELFYDHFSGRYFESTIEDVQRAEYRINRDLVTRGYVYLNEFYEHLKIDGLESGYDLGWSEGGNLERYWQVWIDFTHEKVTMDDGLECHIIVFQEEPYVAFEEYS